MRAFAEASDSAHELVGDELFDLAPPELRRLPSVLPATDVARLVLLLDRLRNGWDEVVWVDADVVVWDPSRVDVTPPVRGVAVCPEVWVTTDGATGGLRALAYVNNAVLATSDAGATRELLDATLARAVAGEVGERSLGPDLLTPRHRRSPMPTVRGVGVVSPVVLADLASGGAGEAVALLAACAPSPLGAANLCASMAGDDVAGAAVARLLTGGSLIPGGPPDRVGG